MKTNKQTTKQAQQRKCTSRSITKVFNSIKFQY